MFSPKGTGRTIKKVTVPYGECGNRTVSQKTMRVNPFEDVKYEAVENKPHSLSKGDVEKLLAFPMQK